MTGRQRYEYWIWMTSVRRCFAAARECARRGDRAGRLKNLRETRNRLETARAWRLSGAEDVR